MPGNEVVSVSNDITVDISRPENTTAYTAGDVIGIAATVAANAGSAILVFNGVPAKAVIEGVSLMINLAAVTSGMTSFRLHLYKTSPAAVLDNAAFDLVAGDRTAYVGYIDIPAPTDLGATLFAQVDQVNKRVSAPSGVLYGVLQTVGAYTPTSSEYYTLTLRVLEA